MNFIYTTCLKLAADPSSGKSRRDSRLSGFNELSGMGYVMLCFLDCVIKELAFETLCMSSTSQTGICAKSFSCKKWIILKQITKEQTLLSGGEVSGISLRMPL